MSNIFLIGGHHNTDYSIIKSLEKIDIYHTPIEVIESPNKKIFLQMEPDNITRCYEYLRKNKDKFDYIICYDAGKVISDKTLPLICGGSWIIKEDYMNIDKSLKKFQISNLCGTKTVTKAHNLRITLYINQLILKDYPIVFFRTPIDGHGSGGDILPDINMNPFIPSAHSSKILLFKEFQYSIVIENSREPYYFSEKLIDCLITKTIPIYYGCENISKFFVTDGWIILESHNIIGELYEKLKILDKDYYKKYEEVIEHNYKKAISYSSSLHNSWDSLNKVPFINVDTSKCNYTY